MIVNRRWTPYAAGFLVCLLFVALGMLVIRYPGAQYDEVLFVSAIHAPGEIEYVLETPFGGVPVMLMTYIGALKAAIYAPILLLAGSGHLTLRVPALGFGAVSIGLFFLALRRLTDTRVAVLASLLLATDAVYLLTCVFDWGPVALQHLLVTAALYALVRFGQEGRGRCLRGRCLRAWRSGTKRCSCGCWLDFRWLQPWFILAGCGRRRGSLVWQLPAFWDSRWAPDRFCSTTLRMAGALLQRMRKWNRWVP